VDAQQFKERTLFRHDIYSTAKRRNHGPVSWRPKHNPEVESTVVANNVTVSDLKMIHRKIGCSGCSFEYIVPWEECPKNAAGYCVAGVNNMMWGKL